jgi:hypothetical protein
VVFCRNTEPRYSQLLDALLEKNIPFIYDLDDNFFELSLDSEIGRYHRHPERLVMLTRYVTSANLVRVYSKPLLERIENLNPKVVKIFAPIDSNLVSSTRKDSNARPLKIVYPTSRFDDDLPTIFMGALMRILKQFEDRVEMHFWGWKSFYLPACPRVFHHKPIIDYDSFLHKFSGAGFDIGLAPLKDDVFHRSKTNNKFREYSLCRIAGVYSDVDVYSDCVMPEETGLLVRNDPESWYQAIARLIEDRDLRERIKTQAQAYVREHYSEEEFDKLWRDQIHAVLTTRDSSCVLDAGVVKPVALKEAINSTIHRKRERVQANLPYMKTKGLSLVKHLRKHGLSTAFWRVRRFVYGCWMVLKLRFLTSSAFDLLCRRWPLT